MAAARGWPWRAELVPDPDPLLAAVGGEAVAKTPPSPGATGGEAGIPSGIVVVTADSVILDHCSAWFNLARTVVTRYVAEARVVDLAGE